MMKKKMYWLSALKSSEQLMQIYTTRLSDLNKCEDHSKHSPSIMIYVL